MRDLAPIKTGNAERSSTDSPTRASELELRPSSPPAFFFSGPDAALTASDQGELISAPLGEPEPWMRRVHDWLASPGERRFVIGAVPFSREENVRLFCPPEVTVVPNTMAPPPSAVLSGRPTDRERGPQSAERDADFLAAVSSATRAIERGCLEKVVLARYRDIALSAPPDPRRVLAALRRANPIGYVYAIRLGSARSEEAVVPRYLVGASPELLLSRRGQSIVSVPLAGSISRGRTPAEDHERAQHLLGSRKDRHEHAFVVDHVVERLRDLTSELRAQSEPTLLATSSMWHLATRVEGRLRDSSVTSLQAALALHPTPAVCGMPCDDARSFIRRSEAFDRGLFAGAVGYMNAAGDGEWAVAIRCAAIEGARARVFAGAGIVEDSVPELELAETDAKMQTMLAALEA